MSEQPVTPEGEHHPDEPPTIVEPPTVAEPSEVVEPPVVAEPPAAAEPPAIAEPVPVVAAPPPPPPVIPPSPAAAAATTFDSDRPENAADRPEIQIGAAFAGGFLLALILKRLAR